MILLLTNSSTRMAFVYTMFILLRCFFFSIMDNNYKMAAIFCELKWYFLSPFILERFYKIFCCVDSLSILILHYNIHVLGIKSWQLFFNLTYINILLYNKYIIYIFNLFTYFKCEEKNGYHDLITNTCILYKIFSWVGYSAEAFECYIAP